MNIGAYAKAIAAFVAPGIVFLAEPMSAGGPPSADDLWKAGAAMLVTAFAVGVVPNRGEKELPIEIEDAPAEEVRGFDADADDSDPSTIVVEPLPVTDDEDMADTNPYDASRGWS